MGVYNNIQAKQKEVEKMKVVIVGGVAGGASAAARLRRLDENAQIIMLERSGFVSYANCGLPYYIGGAITEEEALTLQTPESFWQRFRVDVRVKNEVTEIHAAEKLVTVKKLDTGEVYQETYDKLILSPGAKPTRPNMPGLNDKRVFVLRTVEDTLNIHQFIREQKPQTAVVIGGGFIGLEMAENLTEAGLKVSIVEYADHLLAPLDTDMASQIHTLMQKHGVKLYLNTAVSALVPQSDVLAVQTADGKEIAADMVVLSIGVTPDTEIAKKAGIALGNKGSIKVNSRMETSLPDIYAVGDAVELSHFVTGQPAVIALAGPANKQGRIAADNICGGHSEFKGAQGSSIIKLFDMTAAATGINQTFAAANGIDCDSVILSPASHASYYPGGKVMTMKVVFDKTNGKLLGAQIVGYEGVDKRIDVLATAIRAGLKADELAELDLAYAPPYSSAKDPVNMAGFMIENILTGKVKQLHYEQLSERMQQPDVFLLDTRTPQEYARGHVQGFVNIPVDALRERMDEIPKDKTVYVMCQSGLRSYIACRILSQNGFDCYNFAGGYRFYNLITQGKKTAEYAYPCGMDKKA